MIPIRTTLALLIPFLACGCASATGTLTPLGPDHPASPRATERPVLDPSAFLRLEGGDASPAASPQLPPDPTGRPPAGAYVCPMHAEVASDQPGRCPKCNMKLVPRAEAQPESEEHRHDG